MNSLIVFAFDDMVNARNRRSLKDKDMVRCSRADSGIAWKLGSASGGASLAEVHKRRETPQLALREPCDFDIITLSNWHAIHHQTILCR